MKRILILAVIAIALFSSAISLAQSKLPRKVPKGKTYVYLNDSGKEIARKKAGQSTTSNGITDCAQIPCPSTFGSGIICWKCVERPLSATP